MRGMLLDAMKKLDEVSDETDVLDVMEHIESVEATLAELDRAVLANGLKDLGKKELYIKLLKYIEEDELRHEEIINDIFKKLKI